MKMTEFILALNEKLSALPSEEVEERLDFYCEMISDRIEDGMPEEEAVAKMGTVDEVAEQIIIDIPLSSIVKKKIKSRRKMSATEITLLALGSPIWLSILISLFSVFISLYAAVWSVVISLWACFVSFVAFALLGVVLGGALIFTKNVLLGIAFLGCGIFLLGISVFTFFGCIAATKGVIYLMKKFIYFVKKLFARKEKKNV